MQMAPTNRSFSQVTAAAYLPESATGSNECVRYQLTLDAPALLSCSHSPACDSALSFSHVSLMNFCLRSLLGCLLTGCVTLNSFAAPPSNTATAEFRPTVTSLDSPAASGARCPSVMSGY